MKINPLRNSRSAPLHYFFGSVFASAAVNLFTGIVSAEGLKICSLSFITLGVIAWWLAGYFCVKIGLNYESAAGHAKGDDAFLKQQVDLKEERLASLRFRYQLWFWLAVFFTSFAFLVSRVHIPFC